jgi:glycerophosphoryl diester phosphodiesterase
MVRPVTRRWRVALVAAVLVGSACGDDAASSPGTTGASSTGGPPPTPPPTTASLVTDPPEPAPPVTAPTSAATPTTTPATTPTTTGWSPYPGASTVADLLTLDRPIVIAHAGGDFEWPHSTMYAYSRAVAAGADVLELDVRLTADGVLVVHHDDTLERTTPVAGRLDEWTFDDLSALDNAHWFVEGTWSDQTRPDDEYALRGVRTGERPPPTGSTPDDFRIVTFREVATAFPDHVLDVEIKVPRDDAGASDIAAGIEVGRVLAAEIAELDRTDSVVVVSFDADVIAAFREFAPAVATSPALATLVDWYVGTPVEFAPTDVVFQVPPVYEGVEVLTPDVVDRAQAEGFDVWVWMDDTSTQETAAFYSDLLDRGVDGLLVSRPTVAVEVVADSGIEEASDGS